MNRTAIPAAVMLLALAGCSGDKPRRMAAARSVPGPSVVVTAGLDASYAAPLAALYAMVPRPRPGCTRDMQDFYSGWTAYIWLTPENEVWVEKSSPDLVSYLSDPVGHGVEPLWFCPPVASARGR